MENTTDKKITGISSCLHFAEKWLHEHFGAILGENAVLNKAFAILSTIIIFYFNYLKRQYDVGYYHEVFGIPIEYLGSAWNSTITDLLLSALISIFQSILTLFVFLFIITLLVVVYISSHPQEDYTIKDLIRDLMKAFIGALNDYPAISLAVIIFVFLTLCKPVSKWLMLLASLYCIVLLVSTAILFVLVYRESMLDIHPDEGRIVYVRKLRRLKKLVIFIVVIMFFLSGSFLKWFGRQMAYQENNLKYITIEEGITQQLNALTEKTDDYQEYPCWAIIYQLGENYLIAPCTISANTFTAKIYTNYQCIIPSEGVVVVSDVFTRINVERKLVNGEEGVESTEIQSSEPTNTQNITNPTG